MLVRMAASRRALLKQPEEARTLALTIILELVIGTTAGELVPLSY